MSKQVAVKKEESSLTIQKATDGMFGFDEVTTKDIKIPLIYVAQAMSDIVSSGSAKPGDIVDNLNGSVLGGAKKQAQVVPFFFNKTYTVQKLENGKKVFVTNEPYDREREYEETKDGTTYFNLPSYNFFCLVRGDDSYTRYALSFRGSRNITSGGKPMLSVLFNKYQGLKAAPFNFVFDIGVKQVENEKGKWFVLTSAQAKTEDGKELLSDAATREMAAHAANDIGAMFKSGKNFDLGSEHEAVEDTTLSSEEKDLF
jgi:hypothetical protein